MKKKKNKGLDVLGSLCRLLPKLWRVPLASGKRLGKHLLVPIPHHPMEDFHQELQEAVRASGWGPGVMYNNLESLEA